jgi:AcrR family transcriptional regulator
MSPRPSLAAERRPQILSAAARQIVARGWGHVRLKDVAADAGVAVGTIQHYFPSRQALLLDAFRFANDRTIARWHEIADEAGEDPWQRIVSLVQYCAAPGPDKVELWDVWFEFWPLCLRDPALRETSAEIYELWRQPVRHAIHAGIEHGRFRPRGSVEDAVDTIIGLIDGLSIPLALGHAAIPGERLLRIVLTVAADALGVEDAPSAILETRATVVAD